MSAHLKGIFEWENGEIESQQHCSTETTPIPAFQIQSSTKLKNITSLPEAPKIAFAEILRELKT